MFSQFKRLAAQARVVIDDLEMDLRMTYDLKGNFSVDNLTTQAAQGISYTFNIKSEAPLETVIKIMQAADKGCHTVNSMRKRMTVAGKFVLNEREYQIGD
jgi:hypothetical protein